MKVVKGTQISIDVEARSFNADSMQKDFEYEMAQRLTKILEAEGLISSEESRKTSKLNVDSFEPFYKEIMD